MQTQWIFSSTFLPYTGEPIEFRLEEGEPPLHGIFANGAFQSRWGDYEPDGVAQWRGSQSDPTVVPILIPHVAPQRSFTATLKQLTHLFSRDRNASAVVSSRVRSIARNSTAAPTPTVATATRRNDSNQMSS